MHSAINEYFFYNHVTAEAMDQLWEQGWRHFGRYFFRYSKLNQVAQTYHVLALRIRLSHFSLQKSHKRILKRNRDLRVVLKPAFVNDEAIALFEEHKKRFSENIPESLYVFVSKQPDSVPCNCLSLCVYKEDKLIAMSFLDVGERSCSSVYQYFDLNETKRSLGIFMILLSIRYAQEQNMTFYYPGYAYEEASHYDYKKNFTGLEYFDWLGTWLALEKATPSSI